MSVIAQQELVVKESLFQFITKNVPTADLNVIDDIVLRYVISILEEASQDPCFDVEGFIEIMGAYIPEFATIDAGTVLAWVLQLEADLTQRAGINNHSNHDSNSDHITLELQKLNGMTPPTSNGMTPQTLNGMTPQTLNGVTPRKLNGVTSPKLNGVSKNYRSHSTSESSSENGDCIRTLEPDPYQWSEQFKILSDMFPNTCAMEIKHCLSIARGDTSRAAATLLLRQEQGQALSVAAINAGARPQQPVDDRELKSRIIARYSYVDQDALLKEYKPPAPKMEPKKMIRYRDNKIVSLKGERYTEVPKSGIDDENLKKPKKQHCP